MKIALLGFGTRGDVQPYVVLARALLERGHEAWLAAPMDALAFVERCGVPSRPLCMDAREILESDEGQRLLASGNLLLTARRMAAYTHERRDQLDAEVAAACEGADLVVSPLLLADRVASVCEHRRTPMVLTVLFPVAPTAAFESPLVDLDIPFGPLRWLSHRLAHRAFFAVSRADTDHCRAKLGLPRLSRTVWDGLRAAGTPVFCMTSPSLVPRPSDWDPLWQVSGALLPDAAMRALLGETELPAHLERFLRAGPPPFFIGFGSMPVLDPVRTVRATLDALEAVEGRAVIGAGWSRLPPEVDSPRVCLVGDVDHQAVLPRCEAMVHHGGAGTTAAAARAGIPAAVFSVFGDQPFWGRLVQRAGLGVHRRFRKLDARVLTEALRALREPAVRARASAVGEAMRAEDGTAAMVASLEAWAGRVPVPSLG